MIGLGTLRRVAHEIRADVTSARDRDPAARGVGTAEILMNWAGVQAILAHRVAHALHDAGVPAAPMAISYATRAVTGIEIHPAARIGDEFFIDHGAGVVIGETAEIGDRVTLYQGVTLGGTGFQRGKRHPTLGDNVTVGSGAKLLGPIAVGNPGHTVKVEGRPVQGPDADWIHLPDPIAEAIKTLSARIAEVERRLAKLDGADREEKDGESELRPRTGRSSAGG